MTLTRLSTASAALILAAVSFASTVTYDPAGKQPVRLKVGDTFKVKLHTVSDGGYAWESVGKGRAILGAPVSTVERQAPGNSKVPIVGAPTTTVFTFRALKRGVGKVVLQ